MKSARVRCTGRTVNGIQCRRWANPGPLCGAKHKKKLDPKKHMRSFGADQ